MLDLHMHSTASDGTDTPSEIITKCAKLRLCLASITDHDNIDAQKEAMDCAKKNKIPYITGVEFSVRHIGELHILGYGIDVDSPKLKTMMEDLRESRVERVHAIIRSLHEHDISISFEDVERFAKGNTLGRPHVALALMEKGYASDLQDAFSRYLNESGLCYVQRRKLNPQQAMELILGAGGMPVLAHPKFVKTDDMDALVAQLAREGLAGIEAYYPAHNDADVEKYLAMAKKYNLIVTEGSDYHGKMREYAAIACEKRGGERLLESVKILRGKACNMIETK
ncbi:MAG: PHP domain-containing protein [Christensenella sp.]|nr:PHP domain-containing protein [Christensenella sp.]